MLVTGGSGFIGTNLVEGLRTAGIDVRNFDAVAPRHPAHHPLWTAGDIRDAPAVKRSVDEFAPTAILHLAARCDLRGTSVAEYDANTTGVDNLIAAAAGAGVERVLFASTQLVGTPGHPPTGPEDYNPPNAYGASKVEGERIVRAKAGDAFVWALLRPTSIWGPWTGKQERAFFETVRRGRYVHPRGVRIRKSFGYVGNTVAQVLRLLAAAPDDIHGQVLYVADYEPYPMYEWGQVIASAFGAKPVREVPVGVLRAAARTGDALARVGVPVPLTSYRLRNMMTETVFDMAPLRRLCGDLPFDMASGTKHTVEWLQAL